VNLFFLFHQIEALHKKKSIVNNSFSSVRKAPYCSLGERSAVVKSWDVYPLIDRTTISTQNSGCSFGAVYSVHLASHTESSYVRREEYC
jgi:hypothetical protein